MESAELYLTPKGSNGKLRVQLTVPHSYMGDEYEASFLGFASHTKEGSYFVGVQSRNTSDSLEEAEEPETTEFYIDSAHDAAKLRDFFGAIALAMGDRTERKAQDALYTIGFTDGINSERHMASRRLEALDREVSEAHRQARKAIRSEAAYLDRTLDRTQHDGDREAVQAYGLYDREQAANPDR